MIKKNKRAISPIIGTTLIILMTIAAVAIIWPAIMPIVKRGASGISSACVGIDLTVETSLRNTCLDSTNGILNVTVSRGAGDYELKGIQFILYEGGNSKTTEVNTNLPGINEQRKYSLSTNLTVDKVAIAPIVIMGETEQVCEKTSTTNIDVCIA